MLLVEQNDEWAVNKRYFGLESMELLKTSAGQSVPALDAAAREGCGNAGAVDPSILLELGWLDPVRAFWNRPLLGNFLVINGIVELPFPEAPRDCRKLRWSLGPLQT
jgi:hypothetical protein